MTHAPFPIPMCPAATHLALLSIITAGRTGGGGTGSTVRIIQSGLTYLVLKPMARQSSSLMRFRISYARAAVSSCMCNSAW